jgi:hypothetical protein
MRSILWVWISAVVLGVCGCSSDEAAELSGDAGLPGGGDASVDAGAGSGLDAGSIADGGFDNPLCQFGGAGTQAPGEACGCGADCQGEEPVCARRLDDLLGDGYCSQACAPDGSCPDGLECLELGPVSFCQACAGGEPAGLDEPCVCDSDCGSIAVGGQRRGMSCVGGRCAVTNCVPTTAIGCPDGQFCELSGLEPVCITCLRDTPGSQGDACACQRDCGRDFECAGGECRRQCETSADCAEGRECRVPPLGPSTCVDPAPTCTQTATGTLGAPCTCNADCAPESPVCLSTELLGDFTAGFCTQRPCDISDPEACTSEGPIAFSCCRVPVVFPATCIPGAAAEQLGDVLTCGP